MRFIYIIYVYLSVPLSKLSLTPVIPPPLFILTPAMDLLHTDLWEMELPAETSINYKKWLPEWKKQISLGPMLPTVPTVAQTVSTPLDLSAWCYFLRGYPDRDLAHFFLQGLSEGFRVGFDYQHTVLKSARQNLACAILHPTVVDEYLQIEAKLSRVAGPLSSSNLQEIHYSRFGVIPKKSPTQQMETCHILGNTVSTMGYQKIYCQSSTSLSRMQSRTSLP